MSGLNESDYRKKFARVKCDCGHYLKDHFAFGGWCTKCSCTWYHPNVRYVNREKKKKDQGLAKCTVEYETSGEGRINEEFDRAIQETVERFGLVWYGQGVKEESGVRDISFGLE